MQTYQLKSNQIAKKSISFLEFDLLAISSLFPQPEN